MDLNNLKLFKMALTRMDWAAQRQIRAIRARLKRLRASL